MRSLTYEAKNQLSFKDVETPSIQANDELLIRVSHVGICGTDMLVYHGGMNKRVKPPVILGHEFSGIVEEMGRNVSDFSIGDRVVIEPLFNCGSCYGCKIGDYNLCSHLKLVGVDTDGAMAKYVVVPANRVHKITDALSLESAALVEPLAVCVHMVNKSLIQQGQKALVLGGGPIGLITALVARLHGAEVYIAEINPFRIETAEKLGFVTINPTECDLMVRVLELTEGDGVHVSFEATGTNPGLINCLEATCAKGIVVIAGLPKKQAEFDIYKIIAKELKLVGSRVYNNQDYKEAIELLENKKIDPDTLISRIIRFDDTIKHGFEAIDNGEPIIKALIHMEAEV